MTTSIHALADVQSRHVGAGTRIWQFVVVLPGAQIGRDCNLCAHCFIENDVVVGDRVTVKCGVQLWDGLRIADDVFIGPNVTFTNDRFPRSRQHQEQVLQTHVESGASLGAGAVILPGLRIGRNAMVGAGAVVTRSVPPNAIVVGNPARIVGYVEAKEAPRKNDTGAIRAIERQSRVRGVELIALPRVADIRGSLTAGEFSRSIPFTAQRYFLVFDVPSVETRGAHAHRECHQFLVCPHGSVSLMVDDGSQREEFVLDQPDFGVHIPPMVWGVQYKYAPGTVLLVFASHFYDPADYIRDYDEFLAVVNGGGK
jgi:UDP-2-acetamido-3-amino-2,3-dideoxy-glucuronate N-acetyltransferase